MSDNNKTFAYTYSAKEQEEIKKIREKYTEKPSSEEDKMELLRKLDAGVAKKGTTVALMVGIISAIIMGTGMSLGMTDLGEKLGLPSPIVIGSMVGVIGMIGVAFAYPVYNRITQKERERIAPEIIRLTDELMR